MKVSNDCLRSLTLFVHIGRSPSVFPSSNPQTGNSEVHLDDLCAADPILKTRIDTVLNEKIYPLVRATIGQEADNHIPPQGSLCVYDSILVRYNGEKAKAAGRVGASQPLVSLSLWSNAASKVSFS